MSYPPSLPSRKGGGCIHPARCVHSDLTTAVSWSGLAGTAGRGCQSLAPPAIAAAAAEPRFEAPNTRKNRWGRRRLPTGRYAARCMGRGTEERAQSGAAQTRWMRGLYPRTAAATSSAKVLGTQSKTWMPPTDNCPCPRRPPRAHVAEATAERPLVAHGGGTRTGAARRPSGAVTTGGGRRPPGEAGRHTVRLDEPPASRQPKRRRPPPERVRSAAGGQSRGDPLRTPPR